MNSVKANVNYIILFLLLLIAATLRLIHPFGIPYTGDEFNALYRTHFNSFSELISKGVIIDAHPAGIQVFLFYWTKWFGYSELAVKLPFIICGILSVLYLFFIGRLWFNPTVGLISAAYLATLQYTIMYSQIARPYVSGLFFTLAMIYYWSKILFKSEEHPVRNASLYILFTVLCFYNHYFSMFAAVMVALTGLIFVPKKQFWKYIGLGLIIFLLYLPHLRIFLYQFGIGGIGKQLAKPENTFIIEYFRYVFQFSPYLYISITALIIFGVTASLLKKTGISVYMIISFCWFLIPLLTGFFYSRYVNAVLQYSVLIFSFPFLLFVLFGWIQELSATLKTGVVISICLLNITSLVFERKHYSIFYNSRYEQIVSQSADASKALNPDSCTTLIQSGAEMPENYYVEKNKTNKSSFQYFRDTTEKQDLISLLQNQNKPYLSIGCLASLNPVDMTIFRDHYPYLVKQSDFYGGTFYLLCRHPAKDSSSYTFISTDDFEGPKPLWSANDIKSISDSVFLGGKHSYRMDSAHEWGPTYTGALSQMISNSHDFILISVDLFPQEFLKNVFIVSALESEGKTIDWRAIPVTDFMVKGSDNSWQKAYYGVNLSDINLSHPNIISKIFIWNKGKKAFYMDNFKIRGVKGNPLIYSLFEKI